MNRRHLSAAAALTAAAALLLTACGSSDDKPNDKIAGADSSATAKSPSPSTSVNTPAGATRPDMRLPSDLTESFVGWKTGDAMKDSVLADAGRAQTAVTYAVAQNNADDPALGFYQAGDALVGSAQWVKKVIDSGSTYSGRIRYYMPKINMLGKDAAAVVYCADESKAFNKNRKTNKVTETPPDDNSYVTYSTRLDKNKQGIWQTTKLESKRGDKTCTP
ncbi:MULTISPECIES: hypothetical protein [unclassified Streptomyces]|uniref:hypothetical protein n=1 Tax=unclassified Streptomyces TaxID=2593676 RepID=UPI0038123582|nr:hypothetical protein OG282_18915 [Streptomyces sp. NBC_01014]